MASDAVVCHRKSTPVPTNFLTGSVSVTSLSPGRYQ